MSLKMGFFILFWIFFIYYIAVLAYYFVLALFGFLEHRRRTLQDSSEDYESLRHSYFTLPVSILVPARNEQACIQNTLLSILNLNYDNYEVIVIDDGSTDETFPLLEKLLDLKLADTPYRDHFHSGNLLGFYRSALYPHATVLRKAAGTKKAGALNAGLNLAKYKYVCVIDSDTLLEPNALLQVMSHVEKAPDRVIGVGSYFGLSNGFTIKDGKVVKRSWRAGLLAAYQQLEYIRSFIGTRIVWSRWNSLPIISGAFAVWRRDFLLRIGGFNPEYSSEDVEITFHAQKKSRRRGTQKYEILFLPYLAGWTQGPSNIKGLMTQRNRWQRVAAEAMHHYRDMFFNYRYGMFGLVTLPYFFIYEVFGVVIEVSSIAVTLAGFLMGLMDVHAYAAFLVFMILFQSLTTLIPLWVFNYYQRLFSGRDLLYLTGLSLFELILYRGITSTARLQGLFDFLRGKRSFDRQTHIRPQ